MSLRFGSDTELEPFESYQAQPLGSNGVKLEIEIKKSTSEFEHRFVNDFRTYNCLLGKKFTSVTEEGFVIWKSDNTTSDNTTSYSTTSDSTSESAGSSTVYISEKKERYMLILLEDDYKLFYKKGNGILWTDITDDRIKLYRISLCRDDIDLREGKDYEYQLRMFDYMFYFKKECKEVWYMGRLIWRFNENFITRKPKGFFVNLVNNSFRLNYGDTSRHYDSAPRIKMFKLVNEKYVEMTNSDYITIRNYKWFAFKFIFTRVITDLRITLDNNILWEGDSEYFYSLLIDESDNRIQIDSYNSVITLHYNHLIRNTTNNSNDTTNHSGDTTNLPSGLRGGWEIEEHKMNKNIKIYHYPIGNMIGLVGRSLYSVELIYPGCFEYILNKGLKICAMVIDCKTAYIHDIGTEYLKGFIYDLIEEELEYYVQGKLIQKKWVGMDWGLRIDKLPHLNILEPREWAENGKFAKFIEPQQNLQLYQYT
ncbi:hypothetical protein TpMuguga_04g00407 [Theileria parva strain Muguga]|uniref:Uncharacterized protein n=1 Tax=Theileria parva TaxID=5875 RepID=Q4N2E2_THEPA|nr:uncharacterized protein TpMuguga_04g00407 [Theileria parva strain Muguga]EAN31759.1 hypothetical protein TpMuguga_04g00407 [Theileria parva strain Muguga]|eukprot:XP_764042.1 hypothetical protein [Theileria parva strain Muguga]